MFSLALSRLLLTRQHSWKVTYWCFSMWSRRNVHTARCLGLSRMSSHVPVPSLLSAEQKNVYKINCLEVRAAGYPCRTHSCGPVLLRKTVSEEGQDRSWRPYLLNINSCHLAKKWPVLGYDKVSILWKKRTSRFSNRAGGAISPSFITYVCAPANIFFKLTFSIC